MAQTITPVVHGGRRSRWAASLGLHVAGAVASAGAFGAALGGMGAVLGAPWGRASGWAVAAVALAYALRELASVPVPLPELRRQVPEWWRGWMPAPVAALLYGVGLGVGFLTHLRHGTLVAVAVAAFALGDPWTAAALLAPFGAARAVAVAVAWRASSEGAVAELTERLARVGTSAVPRLVNGAVLVVLAAVALAWAPEAGSPPGWAAPAGLAATFAFAAAAKTLRPDAWRAALEPYTIPRTATGLVAVGVPVAEAGVTFSLLAGSNLIGGSIALALLCLFSVALVRAWRLHGPRISCGCFGRTRERDVRALLVRNAILAAIAVATLLSSIPIPLPPAPSPGDAVPVLLVGVGLAIAAALGRRAAAALRTSRRRS